MRALLLLCTFFPIISVAADWPGVSYSEVRGYAYNKRGLIGTPIVSRGRLAPSVINKSGTPLTDQQVRRLVHAVTRAKPFNWAELCFQPHHAFVFFDRGAKPVAWLEFSEVCNTARAWPQHPGPFDLVVLSELLKELRLPPFP
jgi:hypothetical protein